MSVQSRVKVFESLGNGPSSSSKADLKDWNVLEDPPLINFQAEIPPFPPRNSPSMPPKPGTLTVEQHTYPPGRRGHAQSSSISSFHSVSLSDDERSTTAETADSHFTGFSETASQTSLDSSSFENVSTAESLASPISAKQIVMDWERQTAATPYKARAPKLPQRPAVSPAPLTVTGMHPSRTPSASSSSSDSLRIKSPVSMPASLSSSSSTVILSPSSPAKRPPPPPPLHASISSSVSGSWTPLSPPGLTTGLPSPSPSSPIPSNPPYSPYLRRTTSNSSFKSLQSKQKSPPPPPPLPQSKPQYTGNTTLKRRLSEASTTSSFSQVSHISRPTPVPAMARRRYEVIFDQNVKQARKARRERTKTRASEREKDLLSMLGNRSAEKPPMLSPEAARKTRQSGWRGLSVDLVTGERREDTEDKGEGKVEDEDDDRPVDQNEKIEGYLVKIIWRRSRLTKERLKEIWAECDPIQSGSLDKASFVTGMWRIDEDLRKAQRDPAKYMNETTPKTPTRPSSFKPKLKQTVPSKATHPPALPIRPPPRPVSPQSHSPTSSTSSFVSLGGSSLSSGAPSLSVSPSPPSTFGSYVAVGRVNADGGVGGTGLGGVRRKPPPPPVPIPLP